MYDWDQAALHAVVPFIAAVQAAEVWLLESSVDARTYNNMVEQALFLAVAPLAQVAEFAAQAVFVSFAALSQAVTLAAFVAFIATTDAAQAAPQAVDLAPG